jgi:hypothetical protein
MIGWDDAEDRSREDGFRGWACKDSGEASSGTNGRMEAGCVVMRSMASEQDGKGGDRREANERRTRSADGEGGVKRRQDERETRTLLDFENLDHHALDDVWEEWRHWKRQRGCGDEERGENGVGRRSKGRVKGEGIRTRDASMTDDGDREPWTDCRSPWSSRL